MRYPQLARGGRRRVVPPRYMPFPDPREPDIVVRAWLAKAPSLSDLIGYCEFNDPNGSFRNDGDAGPIISREEHQATLVAIIEADFEDVGYEE